MYITNFSFLWSLHQMQLSRKYDNLQPWCFWPTSHFYESCTKYSYYLMWLLSFPWQSAKTGTKIRDETVRVTNHSAIMCSRSERFIGLLVFNNFNNLPCSHLPNRSQPQLFCHQRLSPHHWPSCSHHWWHLSGTPSAPRILLCLSRQRWCGCLWEQILIAFNIQSYNKHNVENNMAVSLATRN